MDATALIIHPLAPFDFDLTAGYHTYFQSRSGADMLQDGLYRRLLDLDGRLALALVRSNGGIDSPGLVVELRGEDLTEDDAGLASEQIRWMLGTGQDLQPFYSLAENDPTLVGLGSGIQGIASAPHGNPLRVPCLGRPGSADFRQRGQDDAAAPD